MTTTLYQYSYLSQTILLSIAPYHVSVNYKEENIFIESLTSCPTADKRNRNLYFTINLAFAQQLQMNFPEAVLPEDLSSE